MMVVEKELYYLFLYRQHYHQYYGDVFARHT